jgi:hypothetical protein
MEYCFKCLSVSGISSNPRRVMTMAVKDIVGDSGKVILSEKDFRVLVEYLDGIRFGSVTINIRDGKVTGIEKNEKIRFE